MSSTILERLRVNAENSERIEKAIGIELDIKPNGQKQKIYQQHKIANLVDTINKTNKDILDIINDVDGTLNDEISIMKDNNNMFNNFYDTLNTTMEYHSKYSNLTIDNSDTIINNLLNVNIDFSGEEVFGKYLDLHIFHNRYCNLPNIPGNNTIDYIQYLEKFNSFFYISENNKGSKYLSYIKDLLEYLHGFFLRVQPLVDLNELIINWETTFNDSWAIGKINGWVLKNSNSNNKNPQPLNLGIFNAADDLESLGNDRLKEACEAIGLKCGGTIKERALRLWSVRGMKFEDIPQKLKAKKEIKSDENENLSNRKKTAWIEYKIISIFLFFISHNHKFHNSLVHSNRIINTLC